MTVIHGRDDLLEDALCFFLLKLRSWLQHNTGTLVKVKWRILDSQKLNEQVIADWFSWQHTECAAHYAEEVQHVH